MHSGERKRFAISPTVVILGIVSLLTDISSEGIYPLIPLFLVNVLHSQVITVGIIEGFAESTASVLRLFSGWLSDVLKNRKWITVAGYSLSMISKPLLSVATSWGQVFGVRLADRLGKGIRSAPRDALIADVCQPENRGLAFGFHRAMDTVGAVTGPLLVFWLLRSLGLPIRTIFLLSAIPAAIGVIILIVFVKENCHRILPDGQLPRIRLREFSRPFKLFLLVVVVFSIGNSSDAFLILRAQNVGISTPKILLIYVLFNTVEAAFATGAGALSDRIGRRNVIVAGYLIFATVYAGFGFARHPATIWILFGVYGLYNALTQGVQRAFAADLIGANVRGTGMGTYHMMTGLALLPASILAGFLWDSISPSAPFFFGTLTALAAVLLLVILFRNPTTYSDR